MLLKYENLNISGWQKLSNKIPFAIWLDNMTILHITTLTEDDL